MNDAVTSVEMLMDKIRTYSQTSIELIKLKAISKSSNIASTLGAIFVVAITLILFVLMFSIGMACWLGQLTGSIYAGFFIVSGFYAILTVCLFLFRNKWLKLPIKHSFISNTLQP